ncbi:FIG00562380: hypothetical protein [Richelia intracellularis]|nr:FIG00562380: hypothetical protein [Richelia intracellularis]
MNFPQSFQGKEGLQQLLEESCKRIPDDLLFVIDNISTGENLAVGVLWHVELDGIPFPNGRGVSFYRLSATSLANSNLPEMLLNLPSNQGKRLSLLSAQ